ncbi:MAG: NAD(P)/FAD-dependent oxidoreductase [Candidatus Melainabacteria bacterium]|nr:MAG: NAD(P)/FAD-dependent oxidoreductase [Candidatus Melainabacteria bacterium]
MPDFNTARSPLDIGKEWDAIVIGAGPSGALAAYLLAQKFNKVLLVDKAKFPRSKVCGCCINLAAVNILESCSLGYILQDQNAVSLSKLKLFEKEQQANVQLPGGFSLSRSQFDNALTNAAIRSGVTFLSETTATVLQTTPSERIVQLQNGYAKETFSAKVVLVADGLGGHSLNQINELDFVTEATSRFGCGTIIDEGPDFYEPGCIYMVCAHDGYVGLVRLEDGRIDVAAALDRQYSRKYGGPAAACIEIIKSSRLPVPEALMTAQWNGTESLTRRRKEIAAERIFVIGDACGYAEPFTGEGIAWALTSAVGVADLAAEAINCWSPYLIRKWQQKHETMLSFRQKRSRLIAHALRKDAIRRCALPLIASFPALANLVIQDVSRKVTIPAADGEIRAELCRQQ